MESTKVFFLILVSIVGMGYVYSGKKSANFAFVISGVIMMIYPYLIDNTIIVSLLAVVLIVAPFFVKT